MERERGGALLAERFIYCLTSKSNVSLEATSSRQPTMCQVECKYIQISVSLWDLPSFLKGSSKLLLFLSRCRARRQPEHGDSCLVFSQSGWCRIALCNEYHLAAHTLWVAYALCPVTLLENEIIRG